MSRADAQGYQIFRLQSANEKYKLPPLCLGKLAKRWHAAIGISVGNLPKQSAVALILHDRKVQIGGMFFHQARAVLTMTFRAISQEELLASGSGLRSAGQGISFRRSFLRRTPVGIGPVCSVLCQHAAK